MSGWARRLAAAAAGAWIWLAVSAPSGWAAVLTEGSDTAPPYRSPGLGWIELTDQRGISLWQYAGLSINHGGITNPKAFVWSQVVDSPYSIYVNFVAAAIWFLDWTMSFDWVRMLSKPLIDLGVHLQALVDRLGAVNSLLTISAFLAGIWLFRGRNVTAIWEIGSSLVIAALAVGVFASPVAMVSGDDGLLMQTREAGLGFVASVQGRDQDASRSETARNELTSQLITTFVRVPTQLINFGQVLDGGPCESVYDDVIKKGPYPQDDSTIRDKVGECSKAAGEWADDPGVGMAAGSWTVYPSGGWALILCALGGGAVLAAGVRAMYQSLKLIVTMVLGLLPGGGRGSFLLTLSDLLVLLGIVLYTIFFFSLFLQLVATLFAASSGEAVPKTFVIVDIAMIVGVSIYLREKKRLQNASRRLAEWMAQRPGASSTSLPRPLSSGLGSTASGVADTAIKLGMLHAMRASRRGNPGHARRAASRQSDPITLPHQDLRPPPRDDQEQKPDPSRLAITAGRSDPGPSQDAPPPGPEDAPGGGLARIQGRRRPGGLAGTLVRVGAEAVAAHATGGASSAALAAVRLGRSGATSARRAVLDAHLTSVRPPHENTPAPARRAEIIRGELVAGGRAARALTASPSGPVSPPTSSSSKPAVSPGAPGSLQTHRPARARSSSPLSSASSSAPASPTRRPTAAAPARGRPSAIATGQVRAQRPPRRSSASGPESRAVIREPSTAQRAVDRAADRAAALKEREARRLERLREEQTRQRASGRRGPTS